jgi:hypothetical protein
VYCILLTGSAASDGLRDDDDIDFDFIVQDGFKYSSYLLALLVSLKYSLYYGKQFWRRYVICISVIWEKHEVFPFLRKDGQMAFELLNAKVVYNQGFFDEMLTQNMWLKNFFPQLYQQSEKRSQQTMVWITSKNKSLSWLAETFSKTLTFVAGKIVMHMISKDHDKKKRIIAKQPYTLFNIPKKS